MTTGANDPISVRARVIAELEHGRLIDSTPVSHALFERAKKHAVKSALLSSKKKTTTLLAPGLAVCVAFFQPASFLAG